jgi:hypothetical protein
VESAEFATRSRGEIEMRGLIKQLDLSSPVSAKLP